MNGQGGCYDLSHYGRLSAHSCDGAGPLLRDLPSRTASSLSHSCGHRSCSYLDGNPSPCALKFPHRLTMRFRRGALRGDWPSPRKDADMRIEYIRTLKGDNIYHDAPVLVMQLALEDLAGKETHEVTGFTSRLLTMLPGIKQHYCGRGRTGEL